MQEIGEAPIEGAGSPGEASPGGPRPGPGPSPGGRNGRRARVRPGEVGLTVLVGACCLAVNALAVAHVEPLSPANRGPLALAYHDEHRSLIALPLLLALLVLFPALHGAGRLAVIAFVGAASANIVSPALWSAGVPDYIVVRRLELVANLSDVVMVVSAAVVVVSILWNALARSGAGGSRGGGARRRSG